MSQPKPSKRFTCRCCGRIFPTWVRVPMSYLIIATLQNNLVSPFVYGQHLRLDPVAVFVGVFFW